MFQRAGGIASLWKARKLWFGLAAVWALSQLLYFLPSRLYLWLGLVAIWLLFWQLWLQRKIDAIFWQTLRSVLLFTLAFLGLVVFVIRDLWTFETIVLLFLISLWFVSSAFMALRADGALRVKDLGRLYWSELVAFFFAAIGLFSAVQFYALGLWGIWLGMALLLALVFYPLASRLGLEPVKRLFYLALLLLIQWQLLYVLLPWQKSFSFKAFLLFISYYLYVEFLRHYLSADLTLRVVLERLIFGGALLLALLIFDWLLVVT